MKRRVLAVTILLHALLLIAIYMLQGMIFPHLRLYGFAPLLLPVASTGIAVYEGRYTGGVVGIFAGLLCDISLNEPVGLFTVLLTLTGLVAGALADTVLTRGFATFITCCAGVLVLSALAQVFGLLLVSTFRLSLQPLISTAIRQTVYSLIYALPVWFPIRALGLRAQRVSYSERSFR